MCEREREWSTMVMNSEKRNRIRKCSDGVNIRHWIEFFLGNFTLNVKPLETVCLLIAYSYFRFFLGDFFSLSVFFWYIASYRNSVNCHECVRTIGKNIETPEKANERERAKEIQRLEEKRKMFFFSLIFNCSMNDFDLFV